MNVEVISSGSKGNTTYVECNGTKIIIDMGNTCKYVNDKLGDLGIKGENIDAILITHTHVDHIKGLKVFCKKFGTKVYITNGMRNDLSYLDNINIIDSNSFNIGKIDIDVIKTSHDAPDSVGYILHGDGKSLVYITDTGYINKKYYDMLSNKELYVMESNHDIEMLNNGSYPFKLRQRILGDKGHLSNYDASRYLSSFIGDRTKCIILAHLSMENNTEEKAYNTLIQRLNDNNQCVDKIIIAKQDQETELVRV